MKPSLPPFLQEQLDRGVDPLDEAVTREWLEQHPAQLHAFAALRATLRDVACVPPRTAWPRRWPFLLVAGAAAVLVAGLFAALSVIDRCWPSSTPMQPTSAPASSSTVLPRPLFAPRSCVLAIATTERIADDTRTFAFATVQGTLSQKASTRFSTSKIERQPPTVFLRTTVLEETIRP